jgi:hypothetical protein
MGGDKKGGVEGVLEILANALAMVYNTIYCTSNPR